MLTVFRHVSQIGHAFAFSFEKGGTPFCIYKQKRSWHRTTNRGVTMPIHAIALLPGGAVEELHCGSTFTFDRGGWFTAGLYQFVDRNTGQLVAPDPSIPMHLPDVVAPAEEQLQLVHTQPEPRNRAPPSLERLENEEATAVPNSIQQAEELAKTFYGLRVPSIEHYCWLHSGGAQELLGDPGDPLNHPTAISEAIHHHDIQSELTGNNGGMEAHT